MRFLVLTVVLLLAGCAATTPPTDGVQFRSDHWSLAAESGFAVSPMAANALVTDTAEAAALFTNEFYAALQISLPGKILTSPIETLHRLDAIGGGAHTRFRSLRAKLYRNEQLIPEETAAISRDVQHRYLLVGWLEEGESEGFQGYQYRVPGAGQYETVVHGLTYAEIHGRATAVVLDLWANEILWRGVAEYKTGQLYGDDSEIREELDRARASGAITLADYLGEQ